MKEFDAAMAEKAAVMAEAKKCQDKLDMATRLINALSANGVIFMFLCLLCIHLSSFFVVNPEMVSCFHASSTKISSFRSRILLDSKFKF